MFENLRTSTKLVLLCGMFVGAIILATYSLVEEKKIAIGFVRKELIGVRYLEALRGVYAVILAEDADSADGTQNQASADAALDALTKAEAEKAAHSRRPSLRKHWRLRFAILSPPGWVSTRAI